MTTAVSFPNVQHADQISTLADYATLSLPSPNSRRAYKSALRAFLSRGGPLTRENVLEWLGGLRNAGNGPSSLNVSLAAVRLLAREANIRGILSDTELYSIERIRGAKSLGQSTGNWLDLAEVRLLLDAAGEGAHGRRNRAMLALLLGCGLRRAELCALDWAQWQLREGRRCLVDIRGKGGRVRTVPVPAWVADAVEAWQAEARAQEQVEAQETQEWVREQAQNAK